jgi:hypothetical protein
LFVPGEGGGILSLSRAAVNVRGLIEIAEPMLKEGGGGDGCGFGTEDTPAESHDLSARSAGLIEFFVGPTTLGPDDCSHFIRVYHR